MSNLSDLFEEKVIKDMLGKMFETGGTLDMALNFYPDISEELIKMVYNEVKENKDV